MQRHTSETHHPLRECKLPDNSVPPADDDDKDRLCGHLDSSAPTLSEVADSINELTDEPAGLDQRIYVLSFIGRCLHNAERLRDTPGGRDPFSTAKVGTITADAYYAIARRHANDIENQQTFRQNVSSAGLPASPILDGLESTLAMSTKLFEEQVATTAPRTLPHALPEEGTIMPPIDVTSVIDICRARGLYERAWRQKQPDDRQTLLKQSYEISSNIAVDLNTRPELRKARVINSLFNILVMHDLVINQSNDNDRRKTIIKNAILALWSTEELANDLNDLTPYYERVQHFRRTYSKEIDIKLEEKPSIEQPDTDTNVAADIKSKEKPNATPHDIAIKIGNTAASRSLMIA